MALVFHNPRADFFIPDGVSENEALSRVTHLGIGAHQDDLEFMAFHGILTCYHSQEKWFGGVTCTDGAQSPRGAYYASYADADMRSRRQEEQRISASVGRYAAMLQLDYPSNALGDIFLADDLEKILLLARPDVVYTHNLADKHSTHVGVAVTAMEAIRRLPSEKRPSQVLGCEVWRGLDWMADIKKVALNVSGHDHLAAALNGIFDSQIASGKRYDLAIMGRRSANATFFDSGVPDQATQLCFAMDLTPLVKDSTLDLVDYTCSFIEKFREDVRSQIAAHLRNSA